MFGKIKDMLSLDRWIENFEGYLDARIELVKFDVKELVVDLMTRSIFFLGIAIFGMCALICLNIGLAFLISHYIGNEFSGFLILSVFYFIIALVFYLSRNNSSLNEKIEMQIREAMNHHKPESKEKPESDD
jgi:hypothetical protein